MDRYYWLKLQKDFFKRHDIQIVESMPNGKDYILFYLKLLCESLSHEGNLRFSDEIPYSEEMLSTITNTNVDTVRSAIKIFVQLGMMEILDDGTLFMAEVQKMVGSAANNSNANRQRAFRERKKAAALCERNDGVTEHNEKETKPFAGLIESHTDDKELRELIFEFIADRKERRKPMTERAVKLFLGRLDGWPVTEQKRAINEAIVKGWASVFPKKEKEKRKNESVYTSDASYDLNDFAKRAIGLEGLQ